MRSRRRLPREPLLLALFALLSVLAIWIQVGLQLHAAWNDAQAAAVHSAEASADRFVERTQRVLQQIDQVALLVRGEVLARRVVQRRIDGRNLLPTDVVLRANLLDASGRLVAGTEPVPDLDLSEREYFRYHRERRSDTLHAGDPVIGVVTGRTMVPFSRRLQDADGGFAGVVMVTVESSVLTRAIEQRSTRSYAASDAAERSSLSVLRSDGLVIAHEAQGRASSGMFLTAAQRGFRRGLGRSGARRRRRAPADALSRGAGLRRRRGGGRALRRGHEAVHDGAQCGARLRRRRHARGAGVHRGHRLAAAPPAAHAPRGPR